MEPNYQEVANRIRALREDMGLTMQEMADATGRSLAEYQAQESGAEELSCINARRISASTLSSCSPAKPRT